MAFSFVPAGTILPFGGASAPSGWLLCDGSAVSQTAYPALSAAIGVLWGNPGGGSFNLPDGRGAFFRGVGTSGVHVGPGTVGAVQGQGTAKNNLGNAASSVTGTAQSGGVDHTHAPNSATVFFTNEAIPGAQGASFGLRQAYEIGFPTSGGATAYNHTHSLSGTAAAQGMSSTDTETRPNSRGVNYIIKI